MAPTVTRPAAQRVGVAAAQRRHAHATTGCATTCAASTTTTRSTSPSSAAARAAASLLQRLARAGWKVVAFDAGPFWDPDRDWVSDERGSHHLYWTEPRVIAGDDPVPLGSNNSGRGVGGSMVHYAGYTPRLPSVRLRAPTPTTASAPTGRSPTPTCARYYEAIEEELPVAGEDWPWGDPHRYPHSPHPIGGNG